MSFSAIRTRSGSEAASIFRMTWPRSDLDGSLGRAKFSGDLFVQEASDDEREDLAFAWRQRLMASLEFKELLLVLS